MELKQFDGLDRKELSMIEVAYAILEQKGNVVEFTELLIAIQEYLEMSEAALEDKMVRFYTDLNIDGRFISLGENRWGLRAWYPIDSIDEEIISSAEAEEDRPERRRKKRKYNAFSEGDDMIDYNDDDPEDGDDIYEADLDTFEEEEEDTDDTLGLTLIEEDAVDMDEELDEYVSDLSDFGDEELDLEGEDEFVEEVDEFETEDDDVEYNEDEELEEE